jgi:hypothetical protein
MKSLLALVAAGLIILQVSRTHQAAQKQTIIQEHEVVPEMTRAEVQQSLGTPTATSRDSTGQETWIYVNGTTATYVVFSRVGVITTRREILVEPYRRPFMAEVGHGEIPHTALAHSAAPNVAAAPGGLPFHSVGSRLDAEPRRVESGRVESRGGGVSAGARTTGGRPAAPAGEQPVRRMPGPVVIPSIH